ncbi:hypothetical protein [Sphingomonas sp. DC2300-3]|uniref:hypothetical protein n=1 Tax=unclassified Sphingomonas TaxID=196159 RepID=UPI003CF629EB
MSAAEAIFAGNSTALENMHAIAIEGQCPGLSPEGLTPLSISRAGIDRLERQLADARVALMS